MAFDMRYDCVVRLFSTVAMTACLVVGLASLPVRAQSINSGPSVTSLNFGGTNQVRGVSPSVTSMGFGQWGGGFPGWRSGFHSHSPREPLNETHHHRPSYPAWGGYYAYPVFVDSGDAYVNDQPQILENPDEYKGGPTIFDRRGSGQYAAPGGMSYQSTAVAEVQSLRIPQPPVPVAAQPETILVFNDGHQSEVGNYAIVGSTLYDFSGGKRRRIPLSELDLKATIKDNDDRGIDFEIPVSAKSN